MLISSIPLKIEKLPRRMNKAEVPILNHFNGSRDMSFAPISTATPVNRAKANVIPNNTRIGEVSAAKVIVII
jgi:hypothetical protein